MLDPADQNELERLRKFRAPKERDLTLRVPLGFAAQELRRMRRGLGAVAAAWGQIVPPELAERTALVGISRGVLTVRASDASAKYELERLLRSGGEAAVVRASPVSLRRVRVVL